MPGTWVRVKLSCSTRTEVRQKLGTWEVGKVELALGVVAQGGLQGWGVLEDDPPGWGMEEEVPVGQGVAEEDPGACGSWVEEWEEEQQEIQFLKKGSPEVCVQLGQGC